MSYEQGREIPLEPVTYVNNEPTAYIDKDCNILKPTHRQLRVVPMSEIPSITGVGLPSNARDRKTYPVGTGFLDYFPLAAAEVSHVSYVGNEQHNPGQELHWDRSKSKDEADALIRHFLERGKIDSDGVRHSAKLAWRAMALLEKELEAARK